MVVLDTDHMSLLEWEERPETQRLRARLGQLTAADVTTTIISFEEQIRGWMSYLSKATRQDRQIEAYRRLRLQLHNYCEIPVLEFNERAAWDSAKCGWVSARWTCGLQLSFWPKGPLC